MTKAKNEFPPLVCLAPMAGVTDPSFRRLTQDFGVSALWTEMINARGFLEFPQRFPTVNLRGTTTPTYFQIFGAEPTTMALAAKKLQDLGAAGIDINMGCPVKKVVKKGAGAYLMRTPELAARIVSKVRKAITAPLSVKIRSGWDESSVNAAEFAQVLESAGADFLVVHCRTRSQVHSGAPKPEIIKSVKARVSIPVIGNGGITTVEQAREMLTKTGCQGVMIGRGALGRPWFPGEILYALQGEPSAPKAPITLASVVRRHFQLRLENGQPEAGLVKSMRKHLVWYSKGRKDSSQFRQEVMKTDNMRRIFDLIEELLGEVTI
jgi:tRNA-dihydrouridine synthase B